MGKFIAKISEDVVYLEFFHEKSELPVLAFSF
jgi:hypothetical protein